MTRHLKKHALATEDARDDPLGDGTSAAPSRFVWGKKIEKKIRDGADVASLTAAAHAMRAAERLDEIETIKRRREAREAEREAREAEAAAAAREKAVAEGADLEAKEEAFHLDQAKRRAAARVAGGRAGLADVLAKELHLLVPPWSLGPEATPPHVALADLKSSDLRDVVDDVRGWAELDREPRSAGWWAAAGELASAALAAAEAREGGGGGAAPPPPSRDIVTATAAAAAAGAGLHPSVATDVAGLLTGKSLAALEELEEGVKATLSTGDAPDPDFWACVLRALAPAKAAAWLSEAHASLVEGAARAAEAAGGGGGFDDDGGAAPAAAPAAPAAARAPSRSPSPAPPPRPDPNADGALSPPPASDADVAAALAAGAAALTADADARLLARSRAAARYAAAAALAAAGGAEGGAARPLADDDADVLYAQLLAASGGTAAPRDATTVDDARLRAAAAAAMGDAGEAGDAPFTGDATGDAAAATYWWHARYRPRKPTYLNRVHTGYDWNRYNSAHYDTDNPPPKVVKGYKFNIFYPDLIDKSVPPQYSVERDPAAGPQAETVLLRFSAGPPYEDVVFRIDNREWEHARRHGFRCAFERGMLQLYFNFKRQRYRR